MKKLIFVILAVFVFNGANAQKGLKKINFGLSSGIMNVNTKADFSTLSDETISDSSTGFYIGGLVELALTEKFKVQGEALYGNANKEGVLLVPVQAKIKFLPKLSFLVGPQANYSLEESLNDFSSFALDGVAGFAFDVTQNFFAQARYAIPVTDRAKNDIFSLKTSTLNVGIGYKF